MGFHKGPGAVEGDRPNSQFCIFTKNRLSGISYLHIDTIDRVEDTGNKGNNRNLEQLTGAKTPGRDLDAAYLINAGYLLAVDFPVGCRNQAEDQVTIRDMIIVE